MPLPEGVAACSGGRSCTAAGAGWADGLGPLSTDAGACSVSVRRAAFGSPGGPSGPAPGGPPPTAWR
eukprot:14150250-Alexandrium_andersonii.AAC.1